MEGVCRERAPPQSPASQALIRHLTTWSAARPPASLPSAARARAPERPGARRAVPALTTAMAIWEADVVSSDSGGVSTYSRVRLLPLWEDQIFRMAAKPAKHTEFSTRPFSPGSSLVRCLKDPYVSTLSRFPSVPTIPSPPLYICTCLVFVYLVWRKKITLLLLRYSKYPHFSYHAPSDKQKKRICLKDPLGRLLCF